MNRYWSCFCAIGASAGFLVFSGSEIAYSQSQPAAVSEVRNDNTQQGANSSPREETTQAQELAIAEFRKLAARKYVRGECSSTVPDDACSVDAVQLPVGVATEATDSKNCARVVSILTADSFQNEEGSRLVGFLNRARILATTSVGTEFRTTMPVLVAPTPTGTGVRTLCLPGAMTIGDFRVKLLWDEDLNDPATRQFLWRKRPDIRELYQTSGSGLGGLSGSRYFALTRRKRPPISEAESQAEALEPVPESAKLSWTDVADVVFGRQTNSLVRIRITSIPDGLEVLDGNQFVARTMSAFQVSQRKLSTLAIRTGKLSLPLAKCQSIAWPEEIEFRCDARIEK